MEFFPWKDEYSVGIFEIDSQHRKLVDILNRLNLDISEKKYNIMTVVSELIEYTISHFKFEEALLTKYEYPDREKHKILHESLTRDVLAYQVKIEQGESISASKIVDFLSNWLSVHILEEDQTYAHFLMERLE